MFNEKGNYQYPGDMVKSTYDSNNDGVVNAADSVPWSGVTNTPDTLSGYGVESVPASVLSGVIGLEHIPPSAVERMKIVENDSMRFALTTADVQNGDTVKVTATNKMYLVVDDGNLDSESGYAVYEAGRAAAVDWTGVENKPATIVNIDTEINNLKSATESLEDRMTQKADIDGTYEDMTVGTAEAVLSKKFMADSVPYHFRQTPYGDKLKEKIVGGTVAWNQLTMGLDSTYWENESGTTTSFVDGIVTFTSTINNNGIFLKSEYIFSTFVNHKYFLCMNVKSSTAYTGLSIGIAGAGQPMIRDTNSIGGDTAWHTIEGIRECTSSGNRNRFYIFRSSGTVENLSVKNVMFIDLTQMFGSTIADYIYNLEQTTAGAGVALFRELFPKDYYEYDAGSLQSVSGLQSHDEVGFNQWDEEWEVGGYSEQTGEKTTNANYIRTKNLIHCFGGKKYYTFSKNSQQVVFYYYDSNLNYISFAVTMNAEVMAPSNARWIGIMIAVDTVPYKVGDICINISDAEKNGTYEPYKKHSYPLDSSLTLRGVLKLVDNKIKFDGDVYESDGKVTRRYGIVDLGTLTWSKESDGVFYADATSIGLKGGSEVGQISNLICSALTTKSVDQVQKTQDGIGAYFYSGNNTHYLYIGNSSYADANTLKTAMSGVMLVYELVTPTEESAQPYTNPQRCAEGGTEEYVTTGIVPVGHESEYYENIAAKVDRLPYDLSMIAPIENGTTASKAYSAGQYFLHNGQFCKAKTSIASGATFTLNTNYEVTTVANELYTALHS